MRVIDTDYSTYMLLFHCREDYPENEAEEYRYEKAIETHDNLKDSEIF
jgi:hypothetical protein